MGHHYFAQKGRETSQIKLKQNGSHDSSEDQPHPENWRGEHRRCKGWQSGSGGQVGGGEAPKNGQGKNPSSLIKFQWGEASREPSPPGNGEGHHGRESGPSHGGETEKPGLQFPIKVKDNQGQLLWEKRTEMTLPAGSFFHSASQVQPAPRRGVLAGSFFYSANQRKSCPPNWVDAVQYNPEWHL